MPNGYGKAHKDSTLHKEVQAKKENHELYMFIYIYDNGKRNKNLKECREGYTGRTGERKGEEIIL